MLNQINGLHHVTSLASGAQANNQFFTQILGLRRVKKTVNFDAPHVYHLYYGDAQGSPGTVMTYFPFPNARRGRPGTGEVGTTSFAVPTGAIPFWQDRLAGFGLSSMRMSDRFGEKRLSFQGPDGDGFALVETSDARAPWLSDIPDMAAIRGFHSADLRLSQQDADASAELLSFMGYEREDQADSVTRFRLPDGNAAQVIDITSTQIPPSEQGAGSVHHIAFSVDNRAAQLDVRAALMDTGYQVTPVIDRDYFWAIYFRTPGGVLFEIATDEPGFARDEDPDHLGEALKLPEQHEHLRPALLDQLEEITD